MTKRWSTSRGARWHLPDGKFNSADGLLSEAWLTSVGNQLDVGYGRRAEVGRLPCTISIDIIARTSAIAPRLFYA